MFYLRVEQYKGFTIVINYDDNPDDPTTWGDHISKNGPIYQQWKNGEVYSYTVKHFDTYIDSLHGIYGFDNAIEQAREVIDYITPEQKEQLDDLQDRINRLLVSKENIVTI